MTVIVLCDPHDPCGSWLAGGLRERGVDAECITADQLVAAVGFGLRIDDDATRFRIRLRDGRVLTHASVSAVVNRLRSLPAAGDGRADETDRRYALSELNAIVIAWLEAMRVRVRVLDAASAEWVGGTWRSPAEWALLAHAAGLRAVPRPLPSTEEPGRSAPAAVAFVVLEAVWLRGRAIPGSGDRLRDGLIRLARIADADVLQATFDAQGRLQDVITGPDLRPLGDAALDRVTAAVRTDVGAS